MPDPTDQPLLTMHSPTVIVEGPIAFHDYACPVCRERKAILDLSTGIMQPCGGCQKEGYRVRRRWISTLLERIVAL